MLIGQGILLIVVLPLASWFFLALVLSPGLPRSKLLFHTPPLKLNIEPWLLQLLSWPSCAFFSKSFACFFFMFQCSGVTMFLPLLSLLILFSTLALSILRWISTMFVKKFFAKTNVLDLFLERTIWPISSQNH